MQQTKNTMLNTMIAIAAVAHAGQFDKAGRPYILHPLKVMHYLKTNDEELECIGVGHDLFEDTNVTEDFLRSNGISERVITAIKCLTKVEGETYEQYKEKVKSNVDAIVVKMQDLRHNSDIRRLHGITEKDIKRTAKYHALYEELKLLVHMKARLT